MSQPIGNIELTGFWRDGGTPEAIASIRDNTLANCKRTNSAAVIVWGIESGIYENYAGHPSLCPKPELFDDLFAALRTNGYRVGLCIRASVLVDGRHIEVPSSFHNELIREIKYAQDRWQATDFYVDSCTCKQFDFRDTVNGAYVGQQWRDVDLSVGLMDMVVNVTGARLYPEDYNAGFGRARMLPYKEARMGWWGDVTKPALINLAEAPNIPMHADNLVAAVKSGSSLMFRAWWAAPEITNVVNIYRKALA